MTTDTVPKAASAQLQIGGKTVTISGISKGAGMIRPNMATMLGFVATDAVIAPPLVQLLVKDAADESFNRITIDGDTSTNDSFVLIATGQAGHAEVTQFVQGDGRRLRDAVVAVARQLAQAIVRDGEGATKFISVQIDGGRTEAECRLAAYAIAHSPLVKTAFFASDPNLGRILAAVGYAGIADLDQTRIDLFLDDVHVVQDGGRLPSYREEDGQRVMQQSEITVRIDLHRGDGVDHGLDLRPQPRLRDHQRRLPQLVQRPGRSRSGWRLALARLTTRDGHRFMHIALYTPGWPVEDFQNGIVTYVKHMRTALIAMGHRVSVVAGIVGPSNADADVIQVKSTLAYTLRKKLRIATVYDYAGPLRAAFRRLHRADPIDVIEIEESFGWFQGLQSLGIPLVVKLHGPAFLSMLEEELGTPFAAEKVAVEGRALAGLRNITSPSTTTLRDTVAKYGLAGEYRHARNPIDASKMPVWRLDRADPDTALFVGRFDRRKGADRVLHAFKRVLKARPAARLVVAGPDYGIADEAGRIVKFDAYAATVFTPGELQQVSYLGARKPEQIEQLRLGARVTLVASRWENAAYTAAEALGQGCPVVAMACPGMDEVVIDERTGLLVDSVEALAEGILRLMAEPETAARFGHQGRQFILDTHMPDIAVGVALDVYRRVSAGRAAT